MIERRKKPTVTRKWFLIFTEGKKTEPAYFNALATALGLHAENVKVVVNHGRHTDPEGILEEALNERKNKRLGNFGDQRAASYDCVWVVFDTEAKGASRAPTLNNVRQKAARENVELALSQPCFEIWYLLHANPTPPGCGNGKDAKTAMKKCLPDYGDDGEGAAIAAAWALAEKRTANAIKHATRAKSAVGGAWTDVHLLVTELAKLASPAAREKLGLP